MDSRQTVKILLLGGTSEARSLAADVADDPLLDVVSSLAGRVHDPQLPAGATRVGGFGGATGLTQWLERECVDVVVDATHPFATSISSNAHQASRATGTPLVRLVRPAWTPSTEDRWVRVRSVSQAAETVERLSRRSFLTIGRQNVGAFAWIERTWFLVRSIDPPTGALPPHHEVLLARGPFAEADEIELMKAHRIDTMVTKNSGGAMTDAKLAAARRLGVPVVMIDRPREAGADFCAGTVGAVVDWLRAHAHVRGNDAR
ncbi:cobalt-precorrin-6A reductase [Rhodococcus sp. NPDC057297]|uniref:cobalt-precorrin-6A reductase n=1 Tax=Rhodococcus sp. NPDC057297 TaxID=3346090 RepID=UPI00362A1566